MISHTGHAEVSQALANGDFAEASRAAAADPWGSLLVAIGAARAGHFREARVAVDRALRLSDAAPARYVAAHLLFVTRDHGRALELLRQLAGRSAKKLGRVAYRDAIALAGRLGWAADVRELLDGAMAYEPGLLRWPLEAARVHVRGRAWRPALAALESAVRLEDGLPTLWMELAGVAAEADERDRALEALGRALELDRSVLFRLEGARVACFAGDAPKAEALLEEAHRQDPVDGRITLALAEHRLWRHDHAGALALVAEVERGEPTSEEALDAGRIRAAVALFEGEPERALALLDDPGGDYRRPLVRAEALWRTGRVAEAHEALTAASMTAPGFLPVAWLLRMRANFDVEGTGQGVPRERFGEVAELLRGLVPGADRVMEGGDPVAVRDLFDRALVALGGNRTITPTRLVDGRVERLPPITGERFAARRALESIRSLPPAEALARLEAVAERFAGSSLVEAHRGELLLWLGRYEEARASLERSIAITAKTRWPYIGLSALDLVEGEWERSLETNARGIEAMGGTVGAAVYVHRGEALFRLGRLDEAIADLREALRIHPSRVSARLLLALACHARGEPGDDTEASAALDVLFEQAIGLLSDAARLLGTPLLEERDQRPSVASLLPILERAHAMLGANRSSTLMIYRGPAGELRFVQHWPHRGRRVHDTDAEDLERVDSFLRSMLGLSGPRARQSGVRAAPVRGERTAAVPPASERERLEREMLEQGFVTLRGGAPEALMRRIRNDNLRRLRSAPDRYLKRFQPERDALAARAFDPEDPTTFWRGRLDVLGDGLIDIRRELPRVWSALAFLLGGEERIATRRMSEYAILNMRVPAPGEARVPSPGQESWHFDGPSRSTTLGNWKNGLVGLVLLGDVAPGGGATYVAPESVGILARELASAPEGLDLVDETIGRQVSRRCRTFIELHGRAGDVFLLHPFMLHSPSTNASGRVRWLANPMFYVREPLRFEAPAASPVEAKVIAELEKGDPRHP